MTFKYSRDWIISLQSGVDLERHLSRLRISEIAFEGADNKGKIELLKDQFEKLMIASKVKLNDNLLCPYHDDHSPSLKYFTNTKKLYCFSKCYENEGVPKDSVVKSKVHKDAFDLIGDMYGLMNFNQQYDMLVNLFVENPEKFYKSSQQSKLKSPKKVKKEITSRSNKKLLAIEDPDVKKFLNDRGFDDNMIHLFNLGSYEENGRKYATVSCDHGYDSKRYIHFKPKYDGDNAGKYYNFKGESVHLFNSRALKDATTDPIFIVESAFDAIILQSFGESAVATNSISSVGKLIKKCMDINNKNLRLILLFDFDDAGRRATEQVYSQLKDKYNVLPITADNIMIGQGSYLREFRDIGEAYQKDKVKTEKAIDDIKKMRHFKRIDEL